MVLSRRPDSNGDAGNPFITGEVLLSAGFVTPGC